MKEKKETPESVSCGACAPCNFSAISVEGEGGDDIGIDGPVAVEFLVEEDDDAFAVGSPECVDDADLCDFGFGRVGKDGAMTNRRVS